MSDSATKGRMTVIRLVAALISAEILGVFEVTMLLAAMPHLLAEFGSTVTVGWIFTAFGLSSAMCAAIGARIGDIMGRKRILLVAIVAGIIGSLIAGASGGLAGVIVGRILQGSSGAILPLCIGLVRENVSDKNASIAIGALTATITISAGVALILGGVIVDHLSWRWIFFAGAAAGVIALLLVTIWTPTGASAPPKGRINYLGGLLFAPGLGCLLAAITFARNTGWADTGVLMLLGAGLVLLVAWIVSELKARVPLIDVRLLANRNVALANLVFAIVALTIMQKNHLTSLLLQQPEWTGIGLGVTATFSGMVLLPAAMTSFVGGPGSGWLFSRIGGRRTMLVGCLLLLLGWGSLAFSHSAWLQVGIWVTIAGLGLSIVYSVVPMLIVSAVPMERTSEAIGVPTVIRSTFMGLGAQALGFILATSSSISPDGEVTSYPDIDAFNLAFIYMIAGCLLILLISAMLPGSSFKRSEPAAA